MCNIKENLDKLQLKIVSYIKEEDIKNDTKLDLIDSEGYKYYLSNANLRVNIRRDGTLARYFNNNPYTWDNIKLYIALNCGSNVEIISEKTPQNAHEKFKLFCNIHKREFEHSWNTTKNGQYCPLCGIENHSGNGLKHNIEKIKELAKKYNITILDDVYINNEMPLAFVCNNHIDKGIQYKSWGGIITTKHSCNYCASESIIRSNSVTHEEFLNRFKTCFNYNRLNLVGKYKDCKSKIKVECKKCGHKFHLRPDHILRGIGCPDCKITSLGEEIIKYFLKSKNINYEREYRYEDCIDIKPLPFDFYLPNYNYCIEFDGKQHFEPRDFSNNKSEKSAIEKFKLIQYHDEIKNNYCKTNDIKLIRIPYWEVKNIKDILIKELKLN